MARAPFSRNPEQPGNARGERAAGEPPHTEHYGELEIERYVKDDGRALILYTQSREPPNTDGPQ